MSKNYISNIKKDGHFLEFLMTTQDTSMSNALRRVLIAHVPVFAIDENSINITENDTIFTNEKISLVISLIPIINKKNVDYDNIEFELDVEFDINKAENISLYDKKVIVYSDDFNATPKEANNLILKGIPITELYSQQKIRINSVKPILGTQKQNGAGFQTCIVNYNIEDMNDDVVKTRFRIEPRGISVDGKSAYPYNVADTLRLAVEVIIEKIENVMNNLDNYQYNTDKNNGISTVIINNEDDTLGYMLQSMILKSNDFKNKFCGYKNVHPLKKIIEIKMTNDKPKEVISNALKNLVVEFNKIKKEVSNI